MSNNIISKPELLAPAGNLNCALAAFQSGADAVYAGLSRFNAREMGENFNWDDMSRLSAYSKKNSKRFYLTLNTLLKEDELEGFGSIVERIYKLRPDAVIVQDIGVVRFLREYFPQLTIHASTQMGIHNSAGVLAAADMGIDRVILERQVTTDELRQICRQPVEIEVFIHGALCCSISGHCLFSSWLGGWSGNRGRCKQPCRRRFHGEENGTKKSGFFFSTQDYYSLDMLDVLAEAGVCSLKIEGRLKKPDYVKNVVSAYRMMLDAPAADKPSVLKEARAVLAGSYGRKWSHGFSTEEDMESLIQFSSAGVSGRLAGTVEKTAKNGFEASVIQRLHIGDRIRIQPRSGDEGPSITITRMSRDRQQVKSASKGTRVFIHCDKEVAARSMLYKIGESRAETVRNPGDLPLYSAPLDINLQITASASGLRVNVENPLQEGKTLSWNDDTAIEPAENRPLEPGTLVEAFSVTRNENLSAGKISAETGSDLFLPAGRLKKTRRKFWEWLEAQPEIITAMAEGNESSSGWKELFINDKSAYRLTPSAELHLSVFPDTDNTEASKLPGRNITVCGIEDYLNKTGKTADRSAASSETELMLPFFCPENRLSALEEMIRKAYIGGIRRFRITSIYQLELLKKALPGGSMPEDLILSSSFPLPAANSLAAKELKDRGISKIQIWLELEEAAVKAAAESWPAVPEIYRKGKPFLLATRASVSISGDITDSRGKAFTVKQPKLSYLDFSSEQEKNIAGSSRGALTFVFPEEVLALPSIKDCADYYELPSVNGREEETGFNYDFSLL